MYYRGPKLLFGPPSLCLLVCMVMVVDQGDAAPGDVLCDQTNMLMCDTSVFIYCKQTYTTKTNMYNDF